MSYDPADIHLPPHLLRLLDRIEALHIPFAPGWHIGVTRPGAIFSAALIGVWAAALYSGNNLLYLCGAMLMALAIIAMSQTILRLKSAPLFGHLLPDWCQSQSPCILRQTTHSTHLACNGIVTVHWSQLPALATWRCDNDQQLLIAQWQPQQRQMIILQQQVLTTSAPLGLWNISRHRHDPGQWVVMPAIQPMPDTIMVALQQSGASATSLATPLVGGDEFHALRHYAPGDAPTRIHWRKAGTDSRDWRSKIFSAGHEFNPSSHLIVDLRLPSHCNSGQFETLLGQAWGWLREAPPNASITLDSERFSLRHQRQQAIIALAAALPTTGAPLLADDGVVLTIHG